MALSVGLDIGTHHVRALALRGDRVVAHAQVSRRGEDGTERPLTTVVAELAEAIPLTQPGAVASSDLEVLARFLHVAPLPQSRLERILRLELSPEEGAAPCLDAVRLAVEGDDLCYLGLVVESGAVRLLQSELARAGVRPRTVSWGPMALAAAASRVPLEGDQLALVIDIGAAGTDVALVGDGRLLACRRLAIGGDHFTQVLVDTGLTVAEAERAKRASAPILPPPAAEPPAPRPAEPLPAPLPPEPVGDALPALDDGLGELDLAPLPPASEPPPAEAQPELELELDEEPKVRAPGLATVAMASVTLGPQLTRAAEGFYGQLATTLAFFKAQLKRSELQPAKVLICGGGAGLGALEAYLARRFQAPVERFDPCAGLAGAPEREPWLWARALGLAVAASGADVPRVDLRPESDLRREAWRRRLVWPWVAAACLLIAGAVAGLGLTEQIERDRTEAELLERAVEEHKTLAAELAALEAERDAAREDLRAIAGRIHAARDLLYTVRALKEQTRDAKELWVTSLQTVGVGQAEGETPMPTSGKRLSGGARTAESRKDSLIDRGAVDIGGRVRFDARKTDPEMVAFSERYQQALAQWETPEGNRLFRDVILTNRKVERGGLGDGGEFVFKFRCFFPLTSLGNEGQPAATTPAPASTPAPAPVTAEPPASSTPAVEPPR